MKSLLSKVFLEPNDANKEILMLDKMQLEIQDSRHCLDIIEINHAPGSSSRVVGTSVQAEDTPIKEDP